MTMSMFINRLLRRALFASILGACFFTPSDTDWNIQGKKSGPLCAKLNRGNEELAQKGDHTLPKLDPFPQPDSIWSLICCHGPIAQRLEQGTHNQKLPDLAEFALVRWSPVVSTS